MRHDVAVGRQRISRKARAQIRGRGAIERRQLLGFVVCEQCVAKVIVGADIASYEPTTAAPRKAAHRYAPTEATSITCCLRRGLSPRGTFAVFASLATLLACFGLALDVLGAPEVLSLNTPDPTPLALDIVLAEGTRHRH